MTKEMITELISEAEALADRVDQHGVGDSDRSIVRRLVAAVKALEAATPTSTANDREALAKLMFDAVRADESVLFEKLAPWVRSIYLSHADVTLAAGFSRAAVPETETEYGVQWVDTPGQPVTDIGADEADIRELVAAQDGFAAPVHRRVSPWERVPERGEG